MISAVPDPNKYAVDLPATTFGTAYVRLRIDAESAKICGGAPLHAALRLPWKATRSPVRLSRIVPDRIVHPVVVPWAGKRSDIMAGTLNDRAGDLVLAEEVHGRLADAHLPSHLEIPVRCKKVNSMVSRKPSNHPEVPHRWLAWTRVQDMLDELDWSRSTFLYREHTLHGVLAEIEHPFTGVRSFGDRSGFEGAMRAQVSEMDSAYSPVEAGLARSRPTRCRFVRHAASQMMATLISRRGWRGRSWRHRRSAASVSRIATALACSKRAPNPERRGVVGAQRGW